MKTSEEFVLAADLGGTNVRLACFKIKPGQAPKYLLGTKFSSRTGDFADQINHTLELAAQRLGADIRLACFAVAGVIDADGRRAVLPNLDQEIDCEKLYRRTKLSKIILLNDFEALGFGINFLDPACADDLLALSHPGNHHPAGVLRAVKAVIGAGTGLGHGILVYNRDKELYFPIHSEGSHCDLAAVDELEWELVNFLRENVCEGVHPEYERVACGPGLANIYDFLCFREGVGSPCAEAIKNAADKPAAISAHAGSDQVCGQSMRMFINFYARAARHLALTAMATGGVYLGGGITPQILPLLREGEFMKIFQSTDRQALRDVLREIPVRMILNPRTALMGAAAWAIT